jgi:hypothetical protein
MRIAVILMLLVVTVLSLPQMAAAVLVVNSNSTVTDTRTGLIWQQGEPGTMTWGDAISYCEGLSLGGHSDWRLPNVKVLESLTDDSGYPSFDTLAFPKASASNYWLSTTFAGYPGNAWYVDFFSGVVNVGSNKDYSLYVRCVRGGQSLVGNTGVAGASVVLSGAANRTTTSIADGSYNFIGLTNDSYTVTPTLAGYTFTPASRSVAVNGANVTVPAFTAAYIGFTISGNAGVSGATVTLSGGANRTTTSSTDGSYSFTGLDNGSYTVTPSFAGYNFTPAFRNVPVAGANVTAINFTATIITYAISGNVGINNANVSLSGTANRTTSSAADGSYSFTGLANGSYTVTPSLPAYAFTPISRSVTVAGANVTLPAFTSVYVGFTIGGNSGFSGATITLSGAVNRTTTSAADGSFSFTGLANGSYTVTPTLTTYAFTPVSRSVAVAGADVSISAFTAVYTGFTISGNAGVVGATVSLSGAADRTITSSLDGSYAFSVLSNGSYTITPARSGYAFTPSTRSVTVASANVTAIDFSASLAHTISGNAGIANATITLSGSATATVTSAADGSYSFIGLVNGSYTVTPSKTGYGFTLASRSVTVSNADVIAVNFTATPITYRLDVTITGSGSVSINPPGMDCTSRSCQNTYAPLAPVNLTAAFNNLTLFSWGGACGGSKTLCALTMDGNKDVTATFTTAPKIKVDVKEFSALQAAYDDAATTDGVTIKILNDVNVGPLFANRAMNITLSGGHNATYTVQPGMSLLQGGLVVQNGAVVVDRVMVK